MSDVNMVKKPVTEVFPDDVLVKPNFSLDEMDISTTTSSATTTEADRSPKKNIRFTVTVMVAVSIGFSSLFVIPFLSLLPTMLTLPLSIVLLHFLREWYRLHGAGLTRCNKATVNYAGILKEDPTFIPCYELGWIFGDKYRPLAFSCGTGEDLTAEEPASPSSIRENSQK